MPDVDYILPLRWDEGSSRERRQELTAYLERLRRWADVVVVDGSAEPVFAEHHRLWSPLVRHVPPEGPAQPNGKVTGVLTGLRLTGRSRVVLADVAVAARGRAVDGGGAVVPGSAPLWAPAWLAERAVTAWIAVAWRLAGGVPYAGVRLLHAAGPAIKPFCDGTHQRIGFGRGKNGPRPA